MLSDWIDGIGEVQHIDHPDLFFIGLGIYPAQRRIPGLIVQNRVLTCIN
jgi:hypothetical protein